MAGSIFAIQSGPRRNWVKLVTEYTSAPTPSASRSSAAASDYVAAVADLIRPWIADRYVALGTDGFGRSDTRENLRRYFGVGRDAIAAAARKELGSGSA